MIVAKTYMEYRRLMLEGQFVTHDPEIGGSWPARFANEIAIGAVPQ